MAELTSANSEVFHKSASLKNKPVIARLIAEGLDVNSRIHDDWTPLHYAAFRGDLKLVEFLIEHGASPTALTRDFKRPDQIALANGYGEIVTYLYRVMHGKVSK